MRNLLKLFLFGLVLFTVGCNGEINRYQVVNQNSSTFTILDTKKGICKEFSKGKVTIIDFKENEVRRIELNLLDDVNE